MHDTLLQVIFYIVAGLTVLAALMVITQNNPVRCVLFLVLTFFTSSVLWILVDAEFLALILVLVYVGAVMTLFLFVVMMLDIDREAIKTNLKRYLPIGIVIVTLLTTLLLVAINSVTLKTGQDLLSKATTSSNVDEFNHAVEEPVPPPLSDTEALGMVLYTDYVYAFEIAAVILLVAIVAAITLVHRNPRHSKQQNVVQQIMTRREDRVKLVKMKSE